MSDVNGIPTDGEWCLAEGADVMIRARSDLLVSGPESGLAERVVVTWSCRAPREEGLPSSSDYDDIAEFEELLVAFTREGAVLAFVITRAGRANLNFYTSSADWFVERLNEALADKPPMPIELGAEDDPDWSEYRAVMEGIGMTDKA